MNQSLDEALSIEVANRIGSKARAPFENAYRAALETEGASYIQGFLVFARKPNKPVEHAWIEVSDRIVDPNFPHLHEQAEGLYYFPAQRLTVKKLKAILEESKEDYPEDDPLPIYGPTPYEYYGDVMLGGKDYLEAHKTAVTKCRELSRASNN